MDGIYSSLFSDLDEFYSLAEAQFKARFALTFATVELASGTVVGSTRYRAIETAHKRLEIGSTFIAQSWQRTHVNTEAKLLMLQHAFEQWKFNRVEFLTDILNKKSRVAIARLGAKEEGILRSHMVMRDGRIRDSVLFSIVADEWRQLKVCLEALLNGQLGT